MNDIEQEAIILNAVCHLIDDMLNHDMVVEQWSPDWSNIMFRTSVDLSRISSGPRALMLSYFPFESHGTFEPEGILPPSGIVKSVDVLEQCQLALPPSVPRLPPYKLGLHGFEEVSLGT